MKNSNKLKLVLMILICVLIILVGFFGIYLRSGNLYKNILSEYELASDLKGETILEFEVDTSSETIYLDKDGNKVDSSEVTEENEKDYTTEEIPVNAQENLNLQNYKKSVEIMKERLKFLQTDQYRIDLDEQTGKIALSVEDDYIEDVESILPMEGRLQLIDSNTKDVIIDYTDFESAEATYASVDEGNYVTYITYINLKLNDSGIEKINDIDSYKTSTSEEGETTVNNLKVMFDEDEIKEISYDDILLTGKTLRIITAEGLTLDSDINSEMNTNTVVSKLATMGKMPVIYNFATEEFVKSDVANHVSYLIMGLIAICLIISITFIFKYKLNGLLAVIGFVTNVALFLIIIRLTKIQISLNGFAGIIGLITLYSILTNNILKAIKSKDNNFGENIKVAYLNSLNILVTSLIIFVVFSFTSMAVINTMGLLLFWGWMVTLIGSLIFTVPMLAIVNKK